MRAEEVFGSWFFVLSSLYFAVSCLVESVITRKANRKEKPKTKGQRPKTKITALFVGFTDVR